MRERGLGMRGCRERITYSSFLEKEVADLRAQEKGPSSRMGEVVPAMKWLHLFSADGQGALGFALVHALTCYAPARTYRGRIDTGKRDCTNSCLRALP